MNKQRWEENRELINKLENKIERLESLCQIQQQLLNIITKARVNDNPMYPFSVLSSATKVRNLTAEAESFIDPATVAQESTTS